MDSFPIRWRTGKRFIPVETLVRQEAARLFVAYPELKIRRVDFDSIPDSELAAASVAVTVEARAPERQVIVNQQHADAGVAVRRAFDALFRRFDRRWGGDRRHGEPQAALPRAA